MNMLINQISFMSFYSSIGLCADLFRSSVITWEEFINKHDASGTFIGVVRTVVKHLQFKSDNTVDNQ